MFLIFKSNLQQKSSEDKTFCCFDYQFRGEKKISNIHIFAHLGSNQQFGEPGVWARHVKERKQRRRRGSSHHHQRRRRGGPVPRQSITSQARPEKARHSRGVPRPSVRQPPAQSCSCVLRAAPPHIPNLCAVPHPVTATPPPTHPAFFGLFFFTISPTKLDRLNIFPPFPIMTGLFIKRKFKKTKSKMRFLH